MLLLSPVEIFGEAQARIGPNLSLQFRLTGLPYISRKLKSISRSMRQIGRQRSAQSEQSRQAEKAITEWRAANSRQAQYRTIAAALETVRRNSPLQTLASSGEPITPTRVQETIPNVEVLDWEPMEELVQLLEPLLTRRHSKKLINRFTLNFTALLHYHQPEITLGQVAFNSAYHFVGLLKQRKVTEEAWRNLLLGLIDREFVAPYIPTFLWCRKFPADGFVASTSLSLGTLPPCCPWCGKDADVIASFAPVGYLRDAMCLKDGLLGAAVGWHLAKRGIRFWHGLYEQGTEMDFIAIVGNCRVLIECKVFSISVPAKQGARNVRDAVKQLDEHAALLERQGWNLHNPACVVNLTDQNLASLRREGVLTGIAENRLVSYERFSDWLRARIAGQ
jgi:hypothetical protein